MPPNYERRMVASATEAAQLQNQPIVEVTPSRRDFLQYVTTGRDELAVVARLGRAAVTDLVARAQACDDAEVAGLVIGALEDGLSADEARAVSELVAAPILRDVPVLAASQIYFARLLGADAVVLPASAADPVTLREWQAVASSLHMAVVIEVVNTAQLDQALRLSPRAVIGVACVDPAGAVDVAATLALAAQVPTQRVSLALPDVGALADADRLRGAVDAVVVGAWLANSDAPGALVERISRGA